MERKCENRFLLISSSKVDRFTSNQDQNGWSAAHSTHRRIYFTSGYASFCDNL